jgi:hypothetical protein
MARRIDMRLMWTEDLMYCSDLDDFHADTVSIERYRRDVGVAVSAAAHNATATWSTAETMSAWEPACATLFTIIENTMSL